MNWRSSSYPTYIRHLSLKSILYSQKRDSWSFALERDIEKTVPDRDAAIVLYCGGGYRSALAADALQKMGYTNVFSLAGGWRAWNEAKLPVETP